MFTVDGQQTVLYCIKAGSSSAKTALNAFDRALVSAGCGNYNLLKVSSILPAGAKETTKITLPEGSLLATAYSRFIAGPDEYIGETIAASVAIGIPADSDHVGVIMEFNGVCQGETARSKVIKMVKTAMADRGIKEYSIKSASTACKSEEGVYNCAFAHVSLFVEKPE